jgi:hypothetical protein
MNQCNVCDCINHDGSGCRVDSVTIVVVQIAGKELPVCDDYQWKDLDKI